MIRRAAPTSLLIRRAARSTSRHLGTLSHCAFSSRGNHNVIAGAAAVLCATTTVVYCQERPPNPLWPAGISEKDLDDYVDSVLSDSSINMSAIPDFVERAIYKSTVSMTANLIYKALSNVHGVELFGHELQLQRDSPSSGKSSAIDGKQVGINDKIIEQVADRLLSNSAVNQTLVPDVVERQLYINCLKLIFHLVDTMAASFCVTFCGHDLRLHFEPSPKASISAASSTTKVNLAELQAIARNEVESEGIYGEFQIQLQASLYGLVLGLIDDLLANTEIEILSDRVSIDIVKATAAAGNRKETYSKSLDMASRLVPFSIGVGVGAAAAFAALACSRRN